MNEIENRIGFCFDLEGAVVATPVLSMVAAAADMTEEMEILSRATEAGDLPFARSLRLRCRIVDDVPVSEARRRASVASFNTEVAAVIRAKSDRSHVLTDLPDCWLPDLADRLGCEVIGSEADVVEDRLRALSSVNDKAEALARLRDRYDTIVAIGSGASDLGMLEAADVRVIYGLDPPDSLRSIADYWLTSGRAMWALLRPL